MALEYLHTMVRVKDLDQSLDFYCSKLGLVEVSRKDVESGRFTLVFLSAPGDVQKAQESGDIGEQKSPLLELTYNWPAEDGNDEVYGEGRNFGHLAFRVDDIYAVCQSLVDAGVTINRPPRDGYMAFIRSPDNISIELLQRGKRLPAQEPWLSMENVGIW
ncbi:MAG: lactoylglutathione lyase [Alphaproteobacteria bacterium]